MKRTAKEIADGLKESPFLKMTKSLHNHRSSKFVAKTVPAKKTATPAEQKAINKKITEENRRDKDRLTPKHADYDWRYAYEVTDVLAWVVGLDKEKSDNPLR